MTGGDEIRQNNRSVGPGNACSHAAAARPGRRVPGLRRPERRLYPRDPGAEQCLPARAVGASELLRGGGRGAGSPEESGTKWVVHVKGLDDISK